MAKIACPCGRTMSDSTDYIRYKAHFIADQDYYDLFDPEPEDASGLGGFRRKGIHNFGEIFQCPNCQRLIVFRPGQNQGVVFFPEDTQSSRDLLASYLGTKWPGTISATFRNGKGEIFWSTNLESGFLQELSLQDLKDRYQAKFAELSKMKILRSAFLRVDGIVEHEFTQKLSQ